ncbi:carbamoyltransferase HypF [Selenomonas caprae]|uniref:Carbamoyltransferase n=1 Tax=Selenomonas caprae TaxID=2606905 RepID=A0A5D6WPJ3_9FIRM|nr:carbamoyltransferase HypF [Selenomonas caprae]TYZ30056.1 carbamoyltransferase HypF [Selenomonas caprae]
MSLFHSKVYGIVQGVGFRPFVDRLAARFHILGSVCNKGPYVEIFAQGSEEAVHAFLAAIESEPPERATILKLDTERLDAPETYTGFAIIESAKERGDIFVSPDIATCDKCRAELFDPNDRRYLHPFINCTACGPRLTILDSMPYDRERTSMGEFPLCPACEKEYTSPATRRYDAQPVCCNDCGPEVYIIGNEDCRGAAAITRTRQTIAAGGIVAIKGIGGFHLCCDAQNDAAVNRLRTLKHRPVKPFAIMMRDMAAIRRECHLEDGQEEMLTGHQKPILLLKRRAGGQLSDSVAPGNPKVGVMLPYAPVQMLLFDYPDGITMPDALIMTSGNPAGAPICRDDAGAREALSGFTDLMLSHNRKIRIRADDTVMDWLDGKPYMIRRSRGFAPLPFMLKNDFHGQVLGIGGELKNTFCVGSNNLFYPSPYVGDMSDLRTMQALRETIGRLTELLEAQPAAVACDMHPRYNTTAIAQELGLPLFPVQHHYAHILSCMAENDCDEPVIGVSFDGTGYGIDSTIWGGEILRADYAGFTRLGHIAPFLQTGGDKAATEGWRVAIAMLYGLYNDKEKVTALANTLHLCAAKDLPAQFFMADNKVNAIRSTSAGRLFDAVSALLGIRTASTFEGEASMYLEFAAESYLTAQGLPPQAIELDKSAPDLRRLDLSNADKSNLAPSTADPSIILATDELFRHILAERLAGTDPQKLAFLFHAGLAACITAACDKAREHTGLTTCALSGGVFQNHLLVTLVSNALKAKGFRVLRHSLIPPNDGGICLGQAVAAMYHINH